MRANEIDVMFGEHDFTKNEDFEKLVGVSEIIQHVKYVGLISEL